MVNSLNAETRPDQLRRLGAMSRGEAEQWDMWRYSPKYDDGTAKAQQRVTRG